MKNLKLRVLFIEDSEDDFKIMLRELNKGKYEIEYKLIDNAPKLELALEEEWDVIVSDYSMPGFSGYEALSICNKKGIVTPFILVSATVGEELAVEMMRKGARDYIMKHHLIKLLPAIERELENAKIRRERKQAEEALKEKEAFNFASFYYNPIATIVVDKEARILEINLLQEKIGDRSPKKGDVMYRDYAAKHEIDMYAELMECIRTGKTKEYPEMKYNNKFLDITIAPFTKGAIITCINISERKQAESMFQDIIDKNPMSIQIVDREGYTLKVNSAHTKLFGAIPPADFTIFNDSQLKQQGIGDLMDFVKNGEIVHLPEMYYNAHDVVSDAPDVPLWLRAVIFPLKDSRGKPEKFVVTHENITDSKRAESMFQDIVNFNPMSIQIVDREGFTIKANLSYTNLFGAIPPADFSIFNDLEKKGLGELIRQAKNGEVVNFPVIYYNAHDVVSEASDIPLWIQSVLFPLKDNSGKPERFVFMHENITERKQMEDAQRESEERFRDMSDLLPQIIFEADVDGKLTYANRIAFESLGYSQNDFDKGLNVLDMLIPEDRKRDMNKFADKAKGEKNVLLSEYTTLRKDGSTFPVLIFSNAIIRNNKPVGLRGVIVDITERRQAEESLKEMNDKLIRAQRVAHIGSWEDNLSTNELFWSEELYNIMGFPSDIPINLADTAQVFPTEEIERFQQAVTSAINENAPYSMDYKIIRLDGSIRYIHDEGEIIRDGQGKAIWMYGTTQDITERKLAEVELVKAKIKAQESDKLKSAFLCNMSHEIRTPMNAIVGFSNFLKDPDISQKSREQYCEIIDTNSKQLLHIIEDIIEISKIETSELKFVKEETNINEFLNNLHDEYKLGNKNKMVEVRYIIRDDISSKDVISTDIYTDTSRLRQVLNNLISNALKFTKQGFVEFGYKLVQSSEFGVQSSENKQLRTNNSQLITFYVKDTGIGISEEHKEIIFERFRQGEVHSTKTYGGNGLGLAISKSIIKAMGGEIHVESELGKGATFIFTLPYVPVKKTKSKEVASNDSTEMFQDIGKIKILVAEDIEVSYLILKLILEKTKAKLLWAKDGEECIEMFKNNKDIDIVLMDIQMSGMNGLEATKIIKKIRKDVPVIAQTAYAMLTERKLCIDAGCDDVITKPINEKALMEMLKKYIRI